MSSNIKKALRQVLYYIILLTIFSITIFPIIYIFFGSFKTSKEILVSGINILPKNFLLENYKQAWMLADFKQYTWNSMYYSFFVVLATVITSSMGGYVFARGKFPGKKLLFAIFTATMFVSLGSISIFPTLKIAKLLHLNNSLWGVILIHAFGIQITNVYLVRGFVNSLPKELDESAKIDGCNFFAIFVKIISPLLKPIIATVCILSFKGAWNEYLLPMVFTMANVKQAPLTVGIVALKGTGEAAARWNLMFAGAMISVVPMLIVYLSFNKYFLKGMTSGAVKG